MEYVPHTVAEYVLRALDTTSGVFSASLCVEVQSTIDITTKWDKICKRDKKVRRSYVLL